MRAHFFSRQKREPVTAEAGVGYGKVVVHFDRSPRWTSHREAPDVAVRTCNPVICSAKVATTKGGNTTLVVDVQKRPKGWFLQLYENGEPLGTPSLLRSYQDGVFTPTDDRDDAIRAAEATRDLLWPGAQVKVRRARRKGRK